jgi:hypothetical protein
MGLVHSVGLWRGVLAFGFGLVLGLSFDGVPAPEVDEAPAYAGPAGAAATPASDEPVAAERRWQRRRPAPAEMAPAGETTPAGETPQTGETTQTRERTPAR